MDGVMISTAYMVTGCCFPVIPTGSKRESILLKPGYLLLGYAEGAVAALNLILGKPDYHNINCL